LIDLKRFLKGVYIIIIEKEGKVLKVSKVVKQYVVYLPAIF